MRNVTITGVWGRPIRINIPLVVFLPILVWLSGIVAAVGMFVSVPLHELGHSWVALRYGIKIEWITLWILGGLAALKSIPRRFQSWLPGSIKYRARFWPGRER